MPTDYQNSPNRGDGERVGPIHTWPILSASILAWPVLTALAFVSLLFAAFYRDIYQPDALLKQVTHLQELVTVPEAVNRGYFRNSFRLDFVPQNAYVLISSDDYQLYINGRKIGSNEYTINASNPFTGKLSQRSQSLARTQQFSLARAPELQKIANKEKRYAHYYDITPYLVAGKNTLALAIQSDEKVQFSLYGEIQALEGRSYLTSDPREWKYTLLANSDREDRVWYATDHRDTEWSSATSGGAINYAIYALDIESLWATAFDPSAAVIPESDGIERVRGVLPGSLEFKEYPESASWLRVQSSRSYSVYIGDELIGSGSPGQLGAFNISHFVKSYRQPVSVVFFADQQGGDEQLWLKVDGSIRGNFLRNFNSWYQYKNILDTSDRWLTEKLQSNASAWEILDSTYLVHPPQKKMYLGQSEDSIYQYQSYAYAAGLFFILIIVGFLIGQWCRIQFFESSSFFVPRYWWALSLVSIVVAIIEALRFRFVESDFILNFLTDAAKYLFLIVIGLCICSWYWASRKLHQKTVTSNTAFYGHLMNQDRITFYLLFVLILCGIYLRVFGIDSEDLQADENVSWDAARGILRRWSPEAASGVLYTRSPLYHYLLAIWLWLFGDNMIIARLFSVVPALGSIYLSFLLVKSITKNAWLALVAAFILTFDGWEIQISHIIRFYQQMQFFSLLSTYYFLKGFVWRQGRGYQYAFLAACAAAGLSQEVFVTVFPAFGVAFIVFYRNFDWKKEYGLLIGFLTMLAIVVVDIYIFTITCLTPHVSVATTSGSILQLHLSKILGFFNTFFIGNNRANILVSFIVFAGAFYWIRRRNKAVFCLYLLVGLTLTTATVLVMQIAARYLIAIYPYLIILAVLTVYYTTGSFVRQLRRWDSQANVSELISRALSVRWLILVRSLLLLALMINLEPQRVLASIEHPRFPQHLTALEYIARYKTSSDKILSIAPMQAAVAFGGIDYYLQTKLYFDEMYVVDRGAVDRWAGGTLVTNTDKVREIFLRNERVWIILDDLEKRNLSEEVLSVLYQSAAIQQEFFGVEVLLWERSRGSLPVTENRGGSYNQF